MAGELCPHLGVQDDPQTAVAFPSARNCCFRAQKPGRIEIRHQADYCLSGEFAACPIYQGLAAPAPLITEPPQPVRSATRKAANVKPSQATTSATRRTRVRKRDALVLGLVGVLLIGLWVVVLAFLPNNTLAFGVPMAATPTLYPTFVAVEPTFFLPVIERQTSISFTATARPTFTLALTSTRTKKPTRTATKTARATQSPNPTNTLAALPTESCGAPSGWVQYTIRAGDTLSSLSRIFNISIQQLQLANCMGSETTLYAGRLLYVPFYPPATAAPTATQIPTKAPTKTPKPPVTDTPVPTTQPTVEPVTNTPIPQPTETQPSPPPESSPES